MSNSLIFQDVTFDVIDRAGESWLRVHQIGDAFGYQTHRSVLNLFTANSAEFTESMTALVEVQTPGGPQTVRIFSLRGAHLLGMFARTERAKEFRRWVLDVLEREQKPTKPAAALPAPRISDYEIDKDTDLAIKQRARVLCDSWYAAYCLQMRHAVRSGQYGSRGIASWMPEGFSAHGANLHGKAGDRYLIWYTKDGVMHTKKLTADDCFFKRAAVSDLWSAFDRFAKGNDVEWLSTLHRAGVVAQQVQTP